MREDQMPQTKVWTYMQNNHYVTVGPFDSLRKAEKFETSLNLPQNNTKRAHMLDLQKPRNKQQNCLCGSLVHIHKKPTLVLHLSNLCEIIESKRIELE